MAFCNHPLASRIDSGSAGATKLGGSPEWPAMDSAAATNQLSNPLLARTTPTGHRPLAVPVARARSNGANSFGQSSSLSMTISTTPGERSPLPARFHGSLQFTHQQQLAPSDSKRTHVRVYNRIHELYQAF